jgi:predicted phage terminase large subunit-like protein
MGAVAHQERTKQKRKPRVIRLRIGAQPGSQETFLSSRADIVFYGGEAGSAKTSGLVLEGLRNQDVARSGAIIFRRTSPQLEGPGSLWELIREWYPHLGAKCKESPVLKAKFPSGATVQLGHLQYESNKEDHQGKGYSLIGFDELPHFTETQFWYMYSRCRSTSGIRSYIRATMNPDPDSWVKKLILWWLDDKGEYARPERSGIVRWFYRIEDALEWGESEAELVARHPEMVDDLGRQIPPTSFTYILGRLADNKILLSKDPGYRARLMALPLVERERLLGKGAGGNWAIKPAAGLYFKRSWFRTIDTVPSDLVLVVRGWDKAATQVTPQSPDPAWTRGVKMGVTSQGRYVVLHVASLRGSVHENLELMRLTAQQDGRSVKVLTWQDPGQAGKVDNTLTKGWLSGYRVESEVAREDKLVYAGPFSTQVEAGNVDLVAGPWNEEFLSELERFPDGKFKDQVDGASRAFMGVHNTGVRVYQLAMAELESELGAA